jgi:hypothetical protein
VASRDADEEAAVGDLEPTIRVLTNQWRSFEYAPPALAEQPPQDEGDAARYVYQLFDATLNAQWRLEHALRRRFQFRPPALRWPYLLACLDEGRACLEPSIACVDVPRRGSLRDAERKEFNYLLAQHSWLVAARVTIYLAWRKSLREGLPVVELAELVRSRLVEKARQLAPELRNSMLWGHYGRTARVLDAAGFVRANASLKPRVRAGLHGGDSADSELLSLLPSAVAQALEARQPGEPWTSVRGRTMRLIEEQLADGVGGRTHLTSSSVALPEPGGLDAGLAEFEAREEAGRLLDHLAGRLTQREGEVFQLWRQGRSGPEIAEALGVTARTVNVLQGRIRRKAWATPPPPD